MIDWNEFTSSAIHGFHICRHTSTSAERCPQCKIRVGVHEIGTDAKNENFIHSVFENMYYNVTGPWVKLASWIISESHSSCSSGLQLFAHGTITACWGGIQEHASPTCHTFPLLSSPVSYA